MYDNQMSNQMKRNWVMGMPFKVDHYRHFAWALEEAGRLRDSFLWKRSGYPEVSPERTRLKPLLGALVYATARYTNTRFAETFRFHLHPHYDRWMARQLKEGDHIYSSYGYANESFLTARKMGGKTIIDGGNSHPENFWNILSEEHERWNVCEDPISRFHYERSIKMMDMTDHVVSPSRFVTRSFLERGFREDQIHNSYYPVDLSLFTPPTVKRDPNQPFTVINTSGLSLRKGTPYLLEAMRRIKKEIPNCRFMITRSGDHSPLIDKLIRDYRDLDIEWSGYVSRSEMAERFRQADLFMLPSLEDGFARVVTEAQACGLPVLVSENTGAADTVREGINGSVVPIRDVDAMVMRAVEWWDRIQVGYRIPDMDIQTSMSQQAYRKRVVEIVETIDPAL